MSIKEDLCFRCSRWKQDHIVIPCQAYKNETGGYDYVVYVCPSSTFQNEDQYDKESEVET